MFDCQNDFFHFHRVKSSRFLFVVVIPNLPMNSKWEHNDVTVVGGNGARTTTVSLSESNELDIDDDRQVIVIADEVSHLILKWKMGDPTNLIVVATDYCQEN